MPEFVRPRPQFPKRAVVTGGMPNGGKHLTFAHVGLMLRTDTFARFLRDRIGKENVIFVSGTDCYGSPPMEKYRALKEGGKIPENLNLHDFSEKIYHEHKKVFEDAGISFNLYGASAFGDTKAMHEQVSREFVMRLKDVGMVEKQSSYMFYDEKAKVILNGRQVVGKCPVAGCQGEHGYAETCDLGHQYLPQDLIDPISSLTGTKPTLVKIDNLYFKLDECIDLLTDWINEVEKRPDTPSFMVKELKEFLKKPEIYVKREYESLVKSLNLPNYKIEGKDTAPSFTMVFEKLKDREKACEIMSAQGVRYRTGKTLTPFRLTGDLEWGVPCPEVCGIKGATFYVWPESLWAPISFTRTYLKNKGFDDNEWKKFWCSDDSEIYQFIGEDNLYFYGPAQQAMWLYMQGKNPKLKAPEGQLHFTRLVPIKTLLLQGLKAGSSGSIRAPLADEILQYYTSDQYRMHFMGMNLGNNSVAFCPKPFNPDAKPEEQDPVLKEGNLLTNVYNRVLRTLFYSTQKRFNGTLPTKPVSQAVMDECEKALLNYERYMYEKKFHQVVNVVDVFVRNMNKMWANKPSDMDEEGLKTLTVDTVQMIKAANLMLHPFSPNGTEKVREYMGFDERTFDWNYAFDEYTKFKTSNTIKFLEEKEDFFKKHPSQLV